MENKPDSDLPKRSHRPCPIDLNQLLKIARLGCTEKQIAEFFDVSPQTITAWKQEFPDLLATLKDGKKWADEHVIDSLYRRALGYTLELKRGSLIDEKHIPADPLSMIFWLKNRQPQDWRDVHAIESRFVIELTNRVGTALNAVLPERCPHCKKDLTLREETIKTLEQISRELDAPKSGRYSR